MSDGERTAPVEFLESHSEAIRDIIERLAGIEPALRFDPVNSRRFRVGTLEFALLFNQEVFRQPPSFAHLAQRQFTLGIVAFSSGFTREYTAHRMVVVEPV